MSDQLTFRNFLEVVAEGNAILRFQQRQIEAICRHAQTAEFNGHTVPIVNTPVLISEVGNQLCQGQPFVVLWFTRGDGRRVVSLRSDANGLDVSKIAAAQGGGGHPHAAGFVV